MQMNILLCQDDCIDSKYMYSFSKSFLTLSRNVSFRPFVALKIHKNKHDYDVDTKQ